MWKVLVKIVLKTDFNQNQNQFESLEFKSKSLLARLFQIKII